MEFVSITVGFFVLYWPNTEGVCTRYRYNTEYVSIACLLLKQYKFVTGPLPK